MDKRGYQLVEDQNASQPPTQTCEPSSFHDMESTPQLEKEAHHDKSLYPGEIGRQSTMASEVETVAADIAGQLQDLSGSYSSMEYTQAHTAAGATQLASGQTFTNEPQKSMGFEDAALTESFQASSSINKTGPLQDALEENQARRRQSSSHSHRHSHSVTEIPPIQTQSEGGILTRARARATRRLGTIREEIEDELGERSSNLHESEPGVSKKQMNIPER